MKTPISGEQLWYRDSWGIPSAMVVDLFDAAVGLVIGVSNRGSHIRLPLGKFSKTLVECESSSMGWSL